MTGSSVPNDVCPGPSSSCPSAVTSSCSPIIISCSPMIISRPSVCALRANSSSVPSCRENGALVSTCTSTTTPSPSIPSLFEGAYSFRKSPCRPRVLFDGCGSSDSSSHRRACAVLRIPAVKQNKVHLSLLTPTLCPV